MPRFTSLLLSLGLVGLLSACQLSGPAKGPTSDGVTPNAVAGDAIEVTALDSPAPVAAAATTAGPEADPAARVQPDGPATETDEAAPDPVATPAPQPEVAAEAALEVPATPKSDAQIACEKKRGNWSPVGKSGLHICVFNTRDGGKQCTRESQCEGVCLARSGTCSPIKPLVGCNEIFQDDGARVTLCID